MTAAASIGALILTLLGFVGTVSMLIMNLRVTLAMTKLEAAFLRDIGKVELSIANMRAEFATEHSNLYQTISTNLGTMYMNRKESEAMHMDNKNRLDRIETRLITIEERLPV